MPVDEYLRLTEKPYCEYRDGAVSPKALATKLHAIIQRVLMMLLHNLGVEVFPELTVRITPTRYLVPDVRVAGDFPGPYPTEPVQLCCEILSPEDRLGAMLAKCEEYHAWGVPFCWVVDLSAQCEKFLREQSRKFLFEPMRIGKQTGADEIE